LLIALSGFVFLTSCEDNNKSKKVNEKDLQEKREKQRTDSILNSVKIPSGGKEMDIDIRSIETIEQKDLKAFLEKYGKENPEDKAIIYTRFGAIHVQLFNDTPLHRANFIRLAKMGYFETTFFHRIAENFVVQGGNSDNVATQKVRSKVGDYLIPSESDAGHLHNYGAFSAAKYSEQNISKASSPFEFFIVQDKNGAHHLDKKHTVFGKVTQGMDVVNEMAKVETDQSEWPKKNIMIDSIVVN